MSTAKSLLRPIMHALARTCCTTFYELEVELGYPAHTALESALRELAADSYLEVVGLDVPRYKLTAKGRRHAQQP